MKRSDIRWVECEDEDMKWSETKIHQSENKMTGQVWLRNHENERVWSWIITQINNDRTIKVYNAGETTSERRAKRCVEDAILAQGNE